MLHLICKEQRTNPHIDMTLRILDLMPAVACSQAPTDGQLRGQTPLHIVCGGRDVEDGRDRVIEKLVAKKADMEARDLNDRTPLLVTAGAAYRKGALMLHQLGADMKATKPDGRNFADEAMSANRKLADWWCSVTGLQPSSVPRDLRAGLFHREGASDKRCARRVDRKEQKKQRRATNAACSQSWAAQGRDSQSQSSQSRKQLESWTAPRDAQQHAQQHALQEAQDADIANQPTPPLPPALQLAAAPRQSPRAQLAPRNSPRNSPRISTLTSNDLNPTACSQGGPSAT